MDLRLVGVHGKLDVNRPPQHKEHNMTTTTAQEIARINWLLSFEQPQERTEALQRDLAALTA